MKITINATINIIVPTKWSIIHVIIVITPNNTIQISNLFIIFIMKKNYLTSIDIIFHLSVSLVNISLY